MKTKKLFLLFSLITLLASCSKSVEKTSAKLNLKLSGIVNLSSGIGSGGAILFGKSSTGEQFGKVLNGTEENLELTNGDWSFYSVMWEKTTGNNLADVAYCGKSFEKLSGTAVSINLNLNNANCADSDFSGGNHYSKYVSGSNKNTFAKFFIEDCDDLSKTGSITCLLSNQGNALSYRLNFRSYKKSAGSAPVFSNEIIHSQCVDVSSMHMTGMNINFPTSNSAMPFVASVEMYLASTNCALTQPETKGMFTHVFSQGLGANAPNSKMVFNGGYACTPSDAIMTDVCESYMGTMAAMVCYVPATISNFTDNSNCSPAQPAPTILTVRNIKQMVSIPKNDICFTDISTYGVSDSDTFPAGNGTSVRPFKICNEWQINQIGEIGASAAMSTYHYKLLNDLDMNKTDFGAYPKPTCTREAGSLLGQHHNLNPLDGLLSGDCGSVKGAPSFTGSFNGNNKTISHARISADSVEAVGFVRIMERGIIRDLKFENLEVQGMGFVGGIAGRIAATAPVDIRNVKINKLDLEAKYNSISPSISGTYVGGIVGKALKNSSSIFIDQVIVNGAEIYGSSQVGGLIGYSDAHIQRSKFNGLLNVHSSAASSSVGGLVATNAGGAISSSLSEGMINSDARYVGGIVASNEANAILTSVYSTMYLRSFSNEANAYIGGIVASNGNGSYTDVFFDGILVFYGSGMTPVLHSIANGNSSNIASGICRYSDVGNPTASCTMISRSDLTAGTLFNGKTEWSTGVAGTLPRLKWEQETNSRPCLMNGATESVIVQKNTPGRGTVLNPIVICNASQLSAISSLSAGSIAVLGENINLSDWTEVDLIPSFNGYLEGRNHMLYGLLVGAAPLNASGIAMIRSNSGSINNLNLVGNQILSNNQMPYSGILTAKNSGSIKNIKFNENYLLGWSNLGVVAGENTGVIDQIEIKNNYTEGFSYIGGAVGNNGLSNGASGKVTRVSVDSLIKERSDLFPNYFAIGGVVGSNCASCIVDQVLFDGSLALSYYLTSVVPADLGGVVGRNHGTVSNALTTNRSEVFTAVTEGVGGLVGSNSGLVTSSVALGRVLHSNPSQTPMPLGSLFSATVGESNGSLSSLYFLEKQSGTVLMQVNTNQVCGAGNATFLTNIFAVIDSNTPDLYLKPYGNFSNNSLSTFSGVAVTGINSMSYADNCAGGDAFTFIKSHGPTGMSIASFGNPINFTGLNIAYPGHLEENVIEYHKARMYKRAPAMDIPIWVMEDGDDHPKLLQVED